MVQPSPLTAYTSTHMLTLAYLSRGAGDGPPLTEFRGIPEKPFYLFSPEARKKRKKWGDPTPRLWWLPAPVNPASGGSREKCVEVSGINAGASSLPFFGERMWFSSVYPAILTDLFKSGKWLGERYPDAPSPQTEYSCLSLRKAYKLPRSYPSHCSLLGYNL